MICIPRKWFPRGDSQYMIYKETRLQPALSMPVHYLNCYQIFEKLPNRPGYIGSKVRASVRLPYVDYARKIKKKKLIGYLTLTRKGLHRYDGSSLRAGDNFFYPRP